MESAAECKVSLRVVIQDFPFPIFTPSAYNKSKVRQDLQNVK